MPEVLGERLQGAFTSESGRCSSASASADRRPVDGVRLGARELPVLDVLGRRRLGWRCFLR